MPGLLRTDNRTASAKNSSTKVTVAPGACLAALASALGERYRRIARRRGPKRAIVAVGRSMLTVIWHLLSGPEAAFHDLGADFYDNRVNPARRARNHISALQSLGYKATIEPAALPAAA
jgi:hypothetical protein